MESWNDIQIDVSFWLKQWLLQCINFLLYFDRQLILGSGSCHVSSDKFLAVSVMDNFGGLGQHK
jgi:hypothetical protein